MKRMAKTLEKVALSFWSVQTLDGLLEPDGGEQLLPAFCDRFRPNPATWRKDAGFYVCVCVSCFC